MERRGMVSWSPSVSRVPLSGGVRSNVAPGRPLGSAQDIREQSAFDIAIPERTRPVWTHRDSARDSRRPGEDADRVSLHPHDGFAHRFVEPLTPDEAFAIRRIEDDVTRGI